jgi:MFS family permease
VLAFFRTAGPVRRFLLASMQSSVGNAIGYVALLLLAYDRFHSPWAVSLVLLADFLPAIVLAPVFGALADRYSRRLLTVSADLLRCGAFVGLALADSFTAILALALIAGTGTALYHPASKSALAELAGPHAGTAMGALVTIWSAASVAGPALGAALLLTLTPPTLLLLDAATFLISALVLNKLPLDHHHDVVAAAAAPGDVSLAGAPPGDLTRAARDEGSLASAAPVTVASAAPGDVSLASPTPGGLSIAGAAAGDVTLASPAPGGLSLASAAAGDVTLATAQADNVTLAIASGEPVTTHDGDAAIGHGVRAGLRAARDIDGLDTVVSAGVAATLAFSLMNVAEPLLATDELDAGGVAFAVLVCVFGVGSTVGALHGRAELPILLASLAGGGLMLCASALAQSLAFAAVTFLGTGLFAGAVMSSDHQLVARLAPPEIRGRIFGLKDSLDAIAFCSAFVAGGLIATLGDSRTVFAASGTGALLVATLAAIALRHTRVAAAGSGYVRRARQTGRRAPSARRPTGY